ncbi:MAG: prolyl oligopeptidase family serine peptidase [Pirellulaceae bacterium]|nr:prolyl oligopeptidase family serine peptidase [Pirellulaceae bacterium]
MESLIGGRFEENEQQRKHASPVTHVDPPVFTLRGREDTLVPPVHAKTLNEQLKAAQIPNRLNLLDHTGHTLGVHREKSLRTMSKFFDVYLKGTELLLVAFEDFDSSASCWQLTDDTA